MGSYQVEKWIVYHQKSDARKEIVKKIENSEIEE